MIYVNSVSLSSNGEILAIGSPGNNSGYVSIYKNIAGVWVQQGNNVIGEALGDRSGHSVSLQTEQLLLLVQI